MIKKSILLFICLIIFSSCAESLGKKNYSDYVILRDSLDRWIKIGKDNLENGDQRSFYLSKVSQAIDTLSIDTIKIRYLSQLSLAYFRLKDQSQFLEKNTELENFAIRLNDSLRLAESYWDKGAFYDSGNQKNVDSAFYYFNKTEKIFSALNEDILRANVLKDIASVQTDINDNTGALVTLAQALRLIFPYQNYQDLYDIYNLMGVASGALNEYENALEYYAEASEYMEKANLGTIAKSDLENNVGLIYSSLGDIEKAKKEFQKAISYGELEKYYPLNYARLLDHIAMADFQLGEMSTVEDKLYRSQFIRDSVGDLEGLSLNYYNLALVNQKLGREADAFIFASNSRDLAREIDNNLRYLKSLKLLADLDPENSNYYIREYMNLSDSLQQEERRIRNKFDLIRFETEETENRNRQLARQRLIWISIAVGLLMFAMALSIIVIQRIKNQRLKFQQQQQEANQEIFNLMLAQKQKVEEGKQSEQKRISEELHDGILGEMNGVRMVLLGLNKKGDDAAIALREQAIEKLKQVQEEIRSISHELNDASYQKFNNFMNSIEDLLKSTVEPAGIQYYFSYDQDLDWDQLEGVTKINLYRILQESLQNCIKHAAATSIYVSFEVDGWQIVITIQDNGRGFEAGKGKKGIGHKNIESRVRKIKGKWYLKSAPGIGTTVLLEIPMEHISQDAKKEISLPKDLQEA